MATNTPGITLDINEEELQAAIKKIERLGKTLDEKWMKQTHSRHLRPAARAMRSNSKSTRISKMIGVTTARKKSPPFGARVGVVRNSTTLFPKFTSYATAAVIEYGTDQRYRKKRRFGVITGRISTGSMPSAPFLRPAWDGARGEFIKNVEQAIDKRIQEEADK